MRSIVIQLFYSSGLICPADTVLRSTLLRFRIGLMRMMVMLIFSMVGMGHAQAGTTVQTISFNASMGAPMLVGATMSTNAVASSGLPVTYTYDPAICTISAAGLVTAISAGICPISAVQAGDVTYASITRLFNIQVNRVTQTLSFDPTLGAPILVGATVNASAIASSGLLSTYVGTPGVCDVSVTGILTASGAGACQVLVTQSGDITYAPVSRTFNITVSRVSQTLSFNPLLTYTIFVGGSTNLGAVASSGLVATYASTAACSVSPAGIVTGVFAGSCNVTVFQNGDVTYAPTSQGFNLTIQTGSTPQNITLGVPGSIVVGRTGVVSALASSGLAVSLTSTSTSICTITGSSVTALATGICMIAADQAVPLTARHLR